MTSNPTPANDLSNCLITDAREPPRVSHYDNFHNLQIAQSGSNLAASSVQLNHNLSDDYGDRHRDGGKEA